LINFIKGIVTQGNIIFRFDGKSISFSVKVTTKASIDKIGKFIKSTDEIFFLSVYVTAAPDAGKANENVICLLSKNLKIPKSNIHIIRGNTSRKKTILICDLSTSTLLNICSDLQSF
jgi:uncharacterized protein YggU (UPF0235/DUF167 family)